VTAWTAGGSILVRVPGSRRYVPIGQLTEIPLGSIVDARKSKAQITTEVNARMRRTLRNLRLRKTVKLWKRSGKRSIDLAKAP